MKYGENLRKLSVPAWSHNNIDYDDIKLFIKEHTTPGSGKAVAIPGRADEKSLEFENALFRILEEEHDRIDLFVKCKAGEIRARIDRTSKQLKRWSRRKSADADHRIPITRLEKYGQFELVVLRTGDEINALEKFTNAQLTGFRKLLKKYQKWTGSPDLGTRFRDEVLEDPKGFTRLDFGPLRDNNSEGLRNVRSLYEYKLDRPSASRIKLADAVVTTESSAKAKFRTTPATEGTPRPETTSSGNTSPVSELPPFRSYSKKKRRSYPELQAKAQTQATQRYYSEYDHPEDLEGGEDAYFIYVDPDEKPTIERIFDSVIGFFGSGNREKEPDQEALLSPSTPDDHETSSDEDDATKQPHATSYGTLTTSRRPRSHHPLAFLAQFTLICLATSLVVASGGLLAWTFVR